MSDTGDRADSSSTRAAGAGKGRADASQGASDAQSASVLAGGRALAAALMHVLGSLGKLAAAEGRVLKATIPLLVVAVAALVTFGLCLWLCLVALIGWLLMVATGSLGLALGLLVVIHAVLVVGVGLVLLYLFRQAAFPRTRAQLQLLGRTLRYDLKRATGAIEDPLRPPSATRSRSKEEDTP